MTAAIVPANSHKNKSQKKRAVPDGLVYALVFNLVDSYEKEAEKTPDEPMRNYFRNYFAGEAGLSEEQQQILKTVAQNFTSASRLVSYREKLKLSLQYRNELRKLFGDDEFRRFDAYVQNRIVPRMTVLKSGNSIRQFGFSGISVDESQHKLIGGAITYAFDFSSPQIENCSVTATMSGANVSATGSDLDPSCSDHNPTVSLISTNYLPNSRYCITASHQRGEASESSSDCLTTAAVSKVINLSFEQIATDDLPIDTNPNMSNGLRIFPDKKLPTEVTDRRRIRVRAKIGSNTAGVRVYFRSFDPDDPSANAALIDVETTPNAGNDNNGDVDGTPNTRAGQFSSSLTQYDCQVSANNAACFTDSYGEAVVDFTVTM